MPVSPPVHRPAGYKPREAWSRTSKHEGKTTTERGYGWQWQQLRKQVIERDMGLCQPCSRSGITTAFSHVDHIINKASGGSDCLDNLQCICESCHKEKTAKESRHF